MVFSYTRLANSPKKIATYFDHVEKVHAPDKHTVVFQFKEYNAEWDYRFGWGYYSGIDAEGGGRCRRRQLEERQRHRPLHACRLRAGQLEHLHEESDLLGQGEDQRRRAQAALPRQAGLPHHQGRGDLHHGAAGRASSTSSRPFAGRTSSELKKSAPQLQWSRWLNMSGTFLAMRVDTKPFDDIRVRRALNMAVNKQEIVSAYYNGNAELFAYPMHPDYIGYYEPLEAMPDSVKELFTYNPAKAKQLLAEAGPPERLLVQGAGVLVQSRPHGPAAAGRRVSGEGGRQDRDPAHGVRRVPFGDDEQDAYGRLFHEQRAHEPDDHDPQELHLRPDVEPVALQRPGVRQADGRRLSRARRGQAPGRC